MSPRLRFLVAGFGALAAVAAYWLYAAWPVWRGTEIYLPVFTRAQGDRNVWLEFPDARLDPGFPGVTPAAPAGDAVYVPVRATGHLWDATADAETNVRQLAGRTVFVQVQPAGSPITGGGTAWRPVSVSDGLIAGEVNLRAQVQHVDTGGRLDLRYVLQNMRLPSGLAGSRQTAEWKKAPVGPAGVERAVEPRTSAYAILKVLPSGRFAVSGMIIEGKRFPG